MEKLLSGRNSVNPARASANGGREFPETRDAKSAHRPPDGIDATAEPPAEGVEEAAEAVTTPIPVIAGPEETTG
ncbi:hypothetical protein [Planobispora takensis]|nr:hypothetical protein [Planobispora takensis]